jgi:CrcB protein
MMNYLFVFIGGGAGSLLRFFIGQIVFRSGSSLPWGTFISNLIACFIFAIVVFMYHQKQNIPPALNTLLLVGFCGGLSTFSAFSFETFQLLRANLLIYALLNIVLSIGLCLSLFYILNRR